MPDALAIVYKICLENLSAMSDEAWLPYWGRKCKPEYLKPHRGWLFAILKEMAALGRFRCVYHLDGVQRDSGAPPFDIDESYLRPHNTSNQKFNREMVAAFHRLRHQVDWDVTNNEVRRAWLARLIASSALTAQLKLSGLSPQHSFVVPFQAHSGSGAMVAATGIRELYIECDPDTLKLLPLAKVAMSDAFMRCIDQLSGCFEALSMESVGSEARAEIAAEISGLLCCCTAKKNRPPDEKWNARFEWRAVEVLVRSGIADDKQEATEMLSEVGIIAKEWEPPSNSPPTPISPGPKTRLETSPARYQAKYRANPIYVGWLAEAFERRGIITPRILGSITNSDPLLRELQAKYFGDRASESGPASPGGVI